MYRFLFLFLISSFCHAVPEYGGNSGCPSKTLINGVADMRCWNGVDVISLAGDWLLNYETLDGKPVYQGRATLPVDFNNAEQEIPFLGRGIYRATILLAEPLKNAALQLPHSYMARKIVLIDSSGKQEILFDSGIIEKTEHTIFKMRTPLIHIGTMDTRSELIVITYNTESVHENSDDPLLLGSSTSITRHSLILKYISTAVSAVLIFVGLINLVLWMARTKNVSALSLAALSFILSARQITTSGVIYDFLPELLTTFDTAIGWGTLFFGVIFGFIYFRTSFPKLVPKWIPAIGIVMSVIGIIIYWVTPLYEVQIFGIYYRLGILLLVIVMLGHLLQGLHQSNSFLKLTIVSGFIPVLSLAADIIYFQYLKTYSSISFSVVGMAFFVGMQTLLMALRYWSSLKQSEELTIELRSLNASLEDKVAARTEELEQKNKLLQDMARTDPLTKLGNRRAFDDFMIHEVARSHRSSQPFVVCLIDIDNFKPINDKFGHDTGNRVLEKFAEILTQSGRIGDFQARLGGDEFCIILPETTPDHALIITERLRQVIAEYIFHINNHDFSITASFGLALWQPDRSTDQILKYADQALYRAKAAGRNCIHSHWHSTPRNSEEARQGNDGC